MWDPSFHPNQPRAAWSDAGGVIPTPNSEVFGLWPGCCIWPVGSENELAGNLLWSTGKSKILRNIKINWRWSTTPRLSRGQAISQHGLPPFFFFFLLLFASVHSPVLRANHLHWGYFFSHCRIIIITFSLSLLIDSIPLDTEKQI